MSSRRSGVLFVITVAVVVIGSVCCVGDDRVGEGKLEVVGVRLDVSGAIGGGSNWWLLRDGSKQVASPSLKVDLPDRRGVNVGGVSDSTRMVRIGVGGDPQAEVVGLQFGRPSVGIAVLSVDSVDVPKPATLWMVERRGEAARGRSLDVMLRVPRCLAIEDAELWATWILRDAVALELGRQVPSGLEVNDTTGFYVEARALVTQETELPRCCASGSQLR